MPVEDVTSALAEWKTKAPHYRLFRDYYDGRHSLKFATENWQQKYGPIVLGIRENLCPAVVTAHTDPMVVDSWGIENMDAQAQSGLDRLQSMASREAFRCGDAYALVWPGADGQPRAHYHRADQIVPHIDPDNPEVMDRAAKVWQQQDGRGRVNVYYQDRVERWVTTEPVAKEAGQVAAVSDWPDEAGKWLPYADEDGGDIIGHTFGVVPVVWWKRDPDDQHGYGRSILTDVVPLQDALNKSVADLVVTTETYSRPFWYLLSYKPEARFDPATGKMVPPAKFDPTKQQIFTSDSPGPMGQLDPPDLTRLIAVQDAWALKIARVVGIPAYYLTQSQGDVPSGESLRMLTSRLSASVRDFNTASTPVWRGLMQLLGMDGQPEWADPSPVSDAERHAIALQRRDIGMAMADVLDPLQLPDTEEAAQRALDAAEAAQARTARSWAEGNFIT